MTKIKHRLKIGKDIVMYYCPYIPESLCSSMAEQIIGNDQTADRNRSEAPDK